MTQPHYHANIHIEGDALAPDKYSCSEIHPPAADFVVSRMNDGTVLSFYGDLTWDFSPYHAKGRAPVLSFIFWNQHQRTPQTSSIAVELQWLMFLLIWKRAGSPLSVSTLKGYFGLARALGRFAEKANCSIYDVLADEKLFRAFWSSHRARGLLSKFGTLITILLGLGPEATGFRVVAKRSTNELARHIFSLKGDTKQHAPLPTRIYSFILSQLSNELGHWSQVSVRFLELVYECAKNPLLGRDRKKQSRSAQHREIQNWSPQPDFSTLLKEYALQDYFQLKEIAPTVSAMLSWLGEIQVAARIQIIAYSGMRREEADNLPDDCAYTSADSGRTQYLIKGITTKMNGGSPLEAKWVTSVEGHTAIKLAREISAAIYRVLGVTPTSSQARLIEFPLFVSLRYLGFSKKIPKKSAHGGYFSARANLETSPRLRALLGTPIEAEDLAELEFIDRHRAWRTEARFQVGVPWHLHSHQLRRSLALYAQRSGLVSNSSLRRQLQHLTDEMPRYYSRGSDFAKNFLSKDVFHFGHEWQDSKPISAGLGYILNVLQSGDLLFGAHINWLDARTKGRARDIAPHDRDETMRRFKNGEIAYTETLLGGCTNTEKCDQAALNIFEFECIGKCKHFVGHLSKLDRVISVQRKLLSALNPLTVEFRTEQQDLNNFEKIRERVMQKEKIVEAL